MRHPLQALYTAREVEQRQRDAAWQALMAAERRLSHNLAQGRALANYRSQTHARYGAGSDRPLGAEQLRTTHDFSQRLDEALGQQATQGEQTHAQAAQCRAAWGRAQQRLAVFDKLIERRQQALQVQAQRREQRADDERANAAAARGAAPLSRPHGSALEDAQS